VVSDSIRQWSRSLGPASRISHIQVSEMSNGGF
jgi:hypothetical protein